MQSFSRSVSLISQLPQPLLSWPGSCPPGQQIHEPATPDVQPRMAAMTQDVGVVAPGLFKSVGQDRQAVEGPLAVDAMCQLDYGAVVPGEDGGRDGRRGPEGV